MSKTLEAWMYQDPADVAERIELQANYASAKERERELQQQEIQARRQRVRDAVFKKQGVR